MELNEFRPQNREVYEKPQTVDSTAEVPTQEEANSFVLDFAQRIKNGSAHESDFYFSLPETAAVKKDQESIYTRMYRAMFEVARDHPEYVQELGQMQGTIDQNPQMLHPLHHLNIATDVMWDPRIHRYQKDHLIHGLGYALRFMESPEYERVIKEKLNFNDPAHFTNTAHFLEFMQNLYNIGDDYSYGDNVVVSRVINALEDAAKERKGSYLLNMRARQLLSAMHEAMNDEDGDYLWSDNDHIPFEITPGRFAYPHEDGIYMAEIAQTPLVEESISNLRKADDDIREVMKTGQTTFSWSDPVMRARDAAYRSFGTLTPHKIGREDVALPTDETQAEEELHDYAYMLSRPIRGIVKEDFGADITHLSLREQFRFLNYLKTVDINNAQKVQQFTRSFGNDSLRTFLVTSSDETLRKQVFDFAESVPKEEAEKVFAAYGKLVSGIDSVGEYLREQFGHTGGQAAQEVVERMLGRARNLLVHAYEHKDAPDELTALIVSANTENALFLETFRTLRTEGSLKIEDAKEIELAIADPDHTPLSAMDRLKMESISRENYADSPEKFREAVVGSMINHFDASGTHWHVLRYKTVPVAFNRFDEMENLADGRERRYFGSFNVDPSFGNGRMGDVMIEQTVLQEAKTAVLEADCNPKTSVSGRYIEVGFMANDLYDLEGVPSLHIVLDEKLNARSQSKKLSDDELAARAESGAEENGVVYRTSEGSSNLDLIKQGYALTRYLRRGDHFCCAFEKLNALA